MNKIRFLMMCCLLAFATQAFGAPQSLTVQIKNTIAAIEELKDEQSDQASFMLAKVPTLQSPIKTYFRLLASDPSNKASIKQALDQLQVQDPILHAWTVFYTSSYCKGVCSEQRAVQTLLQVFPRNAYLNLNQASHQSSYTFEDGQGLVLAHLANTDEEIKLLDFFDPGLIVRDNDSGLNPKMREAFYTPLLRVIPIQQHAF